MYNMEKTFHFNVHGMTCGGCANGVKNRLMGIDTVVDAHVDLALGQATVTHSGAVTFSHVESVFADTKFTVSNDDNSIPDDGDSMMPVVISALLTLPLVVQMVFMTVGLDKFLSVWWEMALIAPVQFIIGLRFLQGAYHSIKDRALGMDVLVALGTYSAYGLSVYNALHGYDGIYFEASGVIITLVLLGKIIESRAKTGATRALRHLMALRPKHAVVMDGNTPKTVPIDGVNIDDIVMVKPGETIPVDGVIINGTTDVDESLLTGESHSVFKTVNNTVVAGSINGDGALQIRATALAQDNTVNRIVGMVQGALAGKAPVQQVVDKITFIFVPTIVALSVLTAVVSFYFLGVNGEQSLLRAIAVLVIACPCALGLATPTALVSGLGAGARQGIIIQDMAVLSRVQNLSHVVVDKTGTLTHGKMSIALSQILHGDAKQLWGDVIAIQQFSQHPLAQAFVDYGADNDITATDAPVSDMNIVAGQGITATVGGNQYAIGNKKLVKTIGISLPKLSGTSSFIKQGGAILYIVKGTVLVGVVGVQDILRGNASSTVASMHNDGVDVVMMTGDSPSVAQNIALLTGIQTVYAGVKPQDKMSHVQKLQKGGAVVAMVGDGINDAPALAQADIGIALSGGDGGGGTDVAIETAGIVLMQSDIGLLPRAIDIASRTHNKIKQNLFWAFVYNTMAIPLAMGGFLSPSIAGLAMTFSSVSVVMNSWLLSRWK